MEFLLILKRVTIYGNTEIKVNREIIPKQPGRLLRLQKQKTHTAQAAQENELLVTLPLEREQISTMCSASRCIMKSSQTLFYGLIYYVLHMYSFSTSIVSRLESASIGNCSNAFLLFSSGCSSHSSSIPVLSNQVLIPEL